MPERQVHQVVHHHDRAPVDDQPPEAALQLIPVQDRAVIIRGGRLAHQGDTRRRESRRRMIPERPLRARNPPGRPAKPAMRTNSATQIRRQRSLDASLP